MSTEFSCGVTENLGAIAEDRIIIDPTFDVPLRRRRFDHPLDKGWARLGSIRRAVPPDLRLRHGGMVADSPPADLAAFLKGRNSTV